MEDFLATLNKDRVFSYLRRLDDFYSLSRVEHIRLVSLLRTLRWFQEDTDDESEDVPSTHVGNLRPSRGKMALLESLLNSRCFWTPRKLRGQTFREDIQETLLDSASREVDAMERILKRWLVLKLCRNGCTKERVVILTDRALHVVALKLSSSGVIKTIVSKSEAKTKRAIVPLEKVQAVQYGPLFTEATREGTGGKLRVATLEDHLNESSGLPKHYAVRIFIGREGLERNFNELAVDASGFPYVAPQPSDPVLKKLCGNLSQSLTFSSPTYVCGTHLSSKDRSEAAWMLSEVVATEISHAIKFALEANGRRIPEPVHERIFRPTGVWAALHDGMNAGIVTCYNHLL